MLKTNPGLAGQLGAEHHLIVHVHAERGRNYLGGARQLIGAGSPLEWNAPERAPDPERMHEQLTELCRAAAGAAP